MCVRVRVAYEGTEVMEGAFPSLSLRISSSEIGAYACVSLSAVSDTL